MATLTQLLEYRERLEDTRYSGTRRVRDSTGEEVEFRSEAELARALASINRQIAAYAGAARTVQFQTSKGL